MARELQLVIVGKHCGHSSHIAVSSKGEELLPSEITSSHVTISFTLLKYRQGEKQSSYHFGR